MTLEQELAKKSMRITGEKWVNAFAVLPTLVIWTFTKGFAIQIGWMFWSSAFVWAPKKALAAYEAKRSQK